MEDKAEQTEHSKELTAVAATEQGQQLPSDDKSNLEESNVNPGGPGAASTVHSSCESSNRGSPDPECSICLDKLENKSYPDGCYHTFCFICLVEWSKVKTVCPLCNVSFQRIIRSDEDYYERYIGRTKSHMLWNIPKTRRFPFANISLPYLSRHFNFLEAQQHRYTYAPRSLPSVPTNQERSSQESRGIQFRRQVYSENLWAKSDIFRPVCATPAYFRSNLPCTDRLIPWLIREVSVLLNRRQTGFILDLIMTLITQHCILSEEFFDNIQPHFGNNTKHFIHEFWNFINAYVEMEHYDENIQYESRNQTPASTKSDVIYVESSDSEDYPPDMPVSPTMQPSSSSYDLLPVIYEYDETTRPRQRKPIRNLFLKKKSENNLRNFPSPSRPLFPEDLTLPSSSRAFSNVSASTSRSDVTFDSSYYTKILSSEDDESDCHIVNDEKSRLTKCLKVIQISSSSEPEVERPLTPPLPDLELVSDGSLDVIGDGNNSENNSFVQGGSSPVVMNVSDSSKALSPFNADERTIDCVMPCEKQSRKSSLIKRGRYVPMRSRKRARWSSSSSRSRESMFRSWSPNRKNALNEFFGDNRRSLSPGPRFSETSELGESSCKVQLANTDDRYSSSSDSDTAKGNKLRSVLKKGCHRNPSDSSNRSFRSKKSKSKGSIYAPHSVPPLSTNRERNHQESRNIQFRRRVYSENLWAKSIMLRSICASPSLYRADPVFTDRLVPWLTRELTVLLDNEQAGFVLDLIMSVIMKYSIVSEEFFSYVEPHFGSHTEHFVHELWSFANSPFEMEQYDENMRYKFRNQTPASTENVESIQNEDYPPDMPVSPTMQPSCSSSSDLYAIHEYDTKGPRKRKPPKKSFLKKKKN